jgi:hypothetical protein
MNANSFTAPAYLVKTSGGRLLLATAREAEAVSFAKNGKNRCVFQHTRPSGGCEGSYSLLGQYGSQAPT